MGGPGPGTGPRRTWRRRCTQPSWERGVKHVEDKEAEDKAKSWLQRKCKTGF